MKFKDFPLGAVLKYRGVTLCVEIGTCHDCYFLQEDSETGNSTCMKVVEVFGVCCGCHREDREWVCFKEVKK